ncbi:MAG: hypothetical protein KGL39_03835 [Patescibacteria group bacterium]|nr:hypothetical protein [Patescibacteria group bacterium]
MTEEQIKHMVNRFLGWRLPKPWHPDNGISYQRPNYAHAPADHDWPSGTNLFDASQADAMVRYMLEGLPQASSCKPHRWNLKEGKCSQCGESMPEAFRPQDTPLA